MSRLPLVACLLFAGMAQSTDCRVSTGPTGFCAAIRLEPDRAELHTGATLRIRINGLQCSGGLECTDCENRHRRFHWRSSAPDVVTVDSTGAIHARRPGRAEIRFEPDDGTAELAAGMQAVVVP